VKQILIPCEGFKETREYSILKELLTVPEEELSPRERRRIDEAMGYGLVYPASVIDEQDGRFTIASDLGTPDPTGIFSVTFPKGTELEIAISIAGMVADSLVSGEV
jgi:hypothetical protein